MKGSLQIAKIFGIPVQVHWSFTLIFLWIIYLSHSRSWDWFDTMWATLIVITLFVCVLLHEFGHALTARRFGVATHDIILSPIGGVARLDRLPDRPFEEFLVAAAGPLVNIALALVLLPYLLAKGEIWQQALFFIDPSGHSSFYEFSIFDYFVLGLFLLNVTLAVFNLLPAFPMDGGRILRALLSLRFGRTRATRIAALSGQVIAVGIVLYGIWQPSIVTSCIGLFVFVTAAGERRAVLLEAALEKYQVREIARRGFTRIYHGDIMERPVEELTRGAERNFLVFDEWQNLVGTLAEEQLLEAVRQKAFGRSVAEYLRPEFAWLVPGDSLRHAVDLLQQKEFSILPVYDNGDLVGAIDLPAIHQFLKIREKIKT